MIRIKILAAAFLVLVLGGQAFAAGMAVHNEVTLRAARYYDNIDYPEYRQYIVDHPECYQPGSPFPDWGYQTGFPDESEEAHWPPFMEAFAQYIHDNYPKPWDEDTIKMVVFFFGLMGHNSGDVDWHAGEGTIGQMSHAEFHDDFQAAHNIADGGGEIYERYERDMDWLEMDWYFPLEDVVEVYHIRGFTELTVDDMNMGTHLLFLGAIANKLAGWLVYPVFAPRSTFLVEQLQDLFYGGLDGMAVRLTWDWDKYTDYIENGVPKNVSAEYDTYSHEDTSALAQAAELALQLQQMGLLEVTVERSARGVTYHARVPQWLVTQKYERPVQRGGSPAVEIAADVDYGNFGESFATGDYNGDGKLDLAVGSPGYSEVGALQLGAVYIYYGREEWDGQLTADDADVVFYGTETHARLGWALATVDLNADGNDDLAVAAPTMNAKPHQYSGKVFVYYGDGGLSSEPDLAIDGVYYHANLGHSLETGDANGDGYDDLIIASPYASNGSARQSGLAAVFFSDASLAEATDLTVNDADWFAFGAAAFDWYGYGAAFVQSGEERLLLVGAAGTNTGDLQMVGTLYGYDLASDTPTEPVFALTGENQFDKFGAKIAAAHFTADARNVLAVAVPTKTNGNATQAGSVYLIDRAELSGEQTIADIETIGELQGEDKYGRFGWRLLTGDPNGDGITDLLITQPRHDEGQSRVAGAAHLFAGGGDFTGEPTVDDAIWTMSGPAEFGLYGNAALIADLNGDGRDDIVIGGNRDQRLARTAGRMLIYLVGDPEPLTLSPGEIMAGEEGSFTLSGEGFVGDGLALSFTMNNETLTPTDVEVVNAQTITFMLAAPTDAELGAYDLHIATVFGEGDLAEALTVGLPGDDDTMDDDTTDDDTIDDDTADDDTSDDDTVDDDATDDDIVDDDTTDDDVVDDDASDDDAADDDDDDDDSGCGC